MPAKKKVNYKKLLEAVDTGKTKAEIMKEFKFNTAAQFKSHYLAALIDAGKAPAIASGRGSTKAASSSKEVIVSKRGSIVIAKDLITDLGFSEGDKFAIRKTQSGISLKKVD